MKALQLVQPLSPPNYHFKSMDDSLKCPGEGKHHLDVHDPATKQESEDQGWNSFVLRDFV